MNSRCANRPESSTMPALGQSALPHQATRVDPASPIRRRRRVRSRPRCPKWVGALLLLCGALLGTLSGTSALAAPATRVVVEMDPGSQDLDPNLVRRLVRLELADVVIPPPHDAPGPATPPPVYVRIERHESFLSVELWERGLLRGERRVSLRGSPQLTARSVALVSAELAERLAERRKAEARLAAARERRERKRSLGQRGTPLFARVSTGAAVEAANLGWDRQWLFGPGINAELRFERGPRVGLLARGFTGRSRKVNQQWAELGLTAGYLFRLSRRSALGLDLFATAAAVSVPQATRLDDSNSSSSWNSRVGLSAQWVQRFWPNLPLHAGVRAGSTVRKLSAEFDDRDPLTLGGLWLGLELGASFDHIAPP
jgi:hypothetical protein